MNELQNVLHILEFSILEGYDSETPNFTYVEYPTGEDLQTYVIFCKGDELTVGLGSKYAETNTAREIRELIIDTFKELYPSIIFKPEEYRV